MKVNLVLIIIAVSLYFIESKDIESEFHYNLYKSVYLSDRTIVLASEDKIIQRPPRVNMDLIRFLNYRDECFQLNYVVPSISGVNKGELVLYSGCEKNQKILSKFSNILDLNFSVDRNFTLNFSKGTKKINIEIPLFNKKREKKLDTLSSSSTLRYFDGMVLARGESLKEQKGLHVKNENFPEHKVVACYTVADSCEVLLADTCDQCINGSYEVVGKFNCPQGGSRYCGLDRCGEKGWPACRRHKVSAPEGEIICLDGSDKVFCAEKLAVVCVNEQLICL